MAARRRKQELHQALPSFTGFYGALLGLSGFYWVFKGFYWVLLGLTRFYWVLPGFTGLYRVILASCYWIGAGRRWEIELPAANGR